MNHKYTNTLYARETNITMNISETRCEDLQRMHMDQVAVSGGLLHTE